MTLPPGGTSNQVQAPATTAGVHFTEYPLAAITGPVDEGALLADGTLWLSVDNSLAHVTKTGGEISFIPIFDPNCGINCDVVGTGLISHRSDNSLWYGVLHIRGTLSSSEVDWIDGATGVPKGATDTIDGNVSTPVNGPDGRVWFSSCGGTFEGEVPFCDAVAIDSATSAATHYNLGTDKSAPILAPSSHGFLYVFETDRFGTTPEIVQLSSGGVVLHRFALPVSSLGDMAEGSDGNLWMVVNPGDEIERMTPSGEFTTYPVPTARSGARHILRVTDGNIWFTEVNANKIARITPAGTITEFPLPRVDSGPDGIMGVDASTCVITPHGFFYITESTQDAIARVDF